MPVNLLVNLGIKASSELLHKTFLGTADETFHCAKFHSSAVLFPDCQKLTYVKQQDVALPLVELKLNILLPIFPIPNDWRQLMSSAGGGNGHICPASRKDTEIDRVKTIH